MREDWIEEMRGCWVVYKITSGSVVERIKVWRSGTTPTVRRKRVKGGVLPKKAEANLRGAVKRLARILNTNFTERDLFVKLSYTTLPEDWRGQERETANFMQRLKRAIRSAGGGDVKWISVCSEVSATTGEPVRPHVHVIVTGGSIQFRDGHWWCGKRTLDDIWGLGGVYAEPLRQMSDYTPLALYLVRQAGKDENRQKWHSSRNMEKSVVEESVVMTDSELRAPAGSVVTEKIYDPERGINYVRYIRQDKGGRSENEKEGRRRAWKNHCGRDGG